MLPFIGMVMCAPAQTMRQPLSIPYLGLSAYSSQQKDAFSFIGNQAALARIRMACIGVYAEKRFMLAETGGYCIAAAAPSSLGNVGLQVNYAGFKNFNETQAGLAYAHSLGKKADIGIQFNYYNYRVPSYKGGTAVYAEIGALFHISSNLKTGIQLLNPVKQQAVNDAAQVNPAWKFALGYDASANFFIACEMSKQAGMPVNVQAGFQYQFAGQFFARAGFKGETSSLYTGAGLHWKNMRLDIACSYHPQLGFSPGMALFTQFKTQKSDE